MVALTTDTPRVYELGNLNEFPIAANSLIFEGAAVGDNGSGYARPLEGGDAFRGFADRHADNANGGDGDRRIRVRKEGHIILDVAGVTLADVGKPVYAVDDNTFTLSATDASHVGQITRCEEPGMALVFFHASITAPVNT
ncbi:MAG: cytoplasmic protein [Alphaproteobacteria bacterium]